MLYTPLAPDVFGDPLPSSLERVLALGRVVEVIDERRERARRLLLASWEQPSRYFSTDVVRSTEVQKPMSTRSNPFEDLERFFDRLRRQFDEMTYVWDVDEPFAAWPSEAESMAIDLVERDDEFVVTVDLPGFERKEVDVQVTDHTLRIEAEHEEVTDEDRTEGERRFIRHERRSESTWRSIRLPEAVDTENVSARMKNGVLTVTLPRLEAEEARGIEIELE